MSLIHQGNSSITTSVTIHVTPADTYLISWGLLWLGFLAASVVAALQVWKDHKWLRSRRTDLEQAPAGEGESVSSGDITRSVFHRLLLLALLARTVMLPVQIYADPLWWQFIADTLPIMCFASAWTLIVSFFVQLVGVASGTGSNTTPGIVIQISAYIVYVILIATYFWNNVASVLLYALLCCIYAALFGTVVYFGPRLLSLLKVSMASRSALSFRLMTCSGLCILTFGARTVGFARKVVAPPKYVSLWWNNGILELVPAIIFLVLMFPSRNHSSSSNETDTASKSSGGGIRRSRSGGSVLSKGSKGETTSLLKPASATYGATTGESTG